MTVIADATVLIGLHQAPSSFSKHIGRGEREAIALALEIHPDVFIVDDYAQQEFWPNVLVSPLLEPPASYVSLKKKN